MSEQNLLETVEVELEQGMALSKCRQCGCMNDALENLEAALPALPPEAALRLQARVSGWQRAMTPLKYTCLGCAHCFPAVALNSLTQAFPEAVEGQALGCSFEVNAQQWPPVPGEYQVFCEGESCPVAVSTLASVELVDQLAQRRPKALCIVGKTETENIGIDKVVKNTIANPTIRYLLLTGQEPAGHMSGKTLYALWEQGVDEHMRVLGSPGKRPVLRNVTRTEVQTFREQVQVVDLIGCEDVDTILSKIEELAQQPQTSCHCAACVAQAPSLTIPLVERVQAHEPTKVEMDKAGYFVILPQPDSATILVEHYAYDNTLLRVIEGKDARTVYWTMIENGWVSLLSHAAYLGKELTKAELSLQLGFKYLQDGA